MKKYIAVMAVFIIVLQASFLATTVFAANNYILETADYGDIRDTMSDTWVAIDDLGREVSTGATVRDIQEEKHVLMFYYTWHLPMHVSGRNVVLKTADAKSKKQTFRFERMADGSYKITSTYNGFVLAVDGGCTEDTNVLIDSNDNSFSQRWFVRLIDGKYLFIPARNEKCVLGVTGSATGSNVLVKTFTDKASQFFKLSNVTEIDGYNDTASKDGSLTVSQQEVMRKYQTSRWCRSPNSYAC